MRQLYYIIQTLLRGRGSNIIKLVSLTLGLLIGILLFSQIAYELSYENFYHESERVAMLRVRYVRDGIPDKDYDLTTYRPAAVDLTEALPDLVECASLCVSFVQPTYYMNDKKLEETISTFADTLFFRTIGLEVLKGNPSDLAQPNILFLTQSKARELFGSEEQAIGKVVSMNKYTDLTVRGIYRDVPANTTLPHNMLVSLPTLEAEWGRGTWNSNDIYFVLFRLKRAEDVEAMNSRVQKAVERYTETKSGTVVTKYEVIPLPHIHLGTSDNVRQLIILAVLGFSIFFVSIMNYVLAAVASFSRRAKAVGVHKCCGADSGRVLGLFMWETGLLVLASGVLCLLLMHLFRDPIESMLGVQLMDLFTWTNLWVPALTVLLLFLVAGVLPGRMFAHIPVTQVFRRYTDNKRGWKRGLLFVQFIGVSFILGVLLTTVWQYHDLMQRKVGFNIERLAVGRVQGEADQEAMESVIRQQPYVESVARCHNSLLTHYSTSGLYDDKDNFLAPLHWQYITREFPQQVGLTLVEGHWPQHKGEAIISRTTVETMKWGDRAIGQKLPVKESFQSKELAVVVGVIDDVRNMGFFQGATCTAFVLTEEPLCPSFNVRLKEPADENLVRLNNYVKQVYPKLDMEFISYADIQRQSYESVYRFRNTVWVTSGCILLIVLLGLIGYVSDETQRRSKEIAVRKVNGAEASDILRLLSVGILKVAIGAVILGTGVAWYVSGLWLEQFADSAMLPSLWFVALTAVLLLLIVVVVMLRAWRIANENPVNSIKSE